MSQHKHRSTAGYAMFGQMPVNMLLVFEFADVWKSAQNAEGALPIAGG